jgi:hypothetical protein
MNCFYSGSLIIGPYKTMTFYRRPCFIRIRAINIQYLCIDGKYIIDVAKFRNGGKNELYLPSMHQYCIYPAIKIKINSII